MKYALATICSVMALSGCATVTYTPPTEVDVVRSKIYQSDYDATWTKAVDWFADHNVEIEKIQKESGLLTAKYQIPASEKIVDCGEIKSSGGQIGTEQLSRRGSLNVTVRKVNDGSTKVNVNFFGNYEFKVFDPMNSRWLRSEGRCVSTGMLEENILGYLN